MRAWRGWLVSVLLAGAGWANAGPAHEHGVARLQVGVEPGRVILWLDTPLDNLLGFEYAPRTDAERSAAATALKALRDTGALFSVDGAAGCQAGVASIKSAPLGLDAAPADKDSDAHGDLEGRYEFRCRSGTRAGFVEVRLFDAFPRLQRIELQIATARGQMKATLKRPNTRIALAR